MTMMITMTATTTTTGLAQAAKAWLLNPMKGGLRP
jgi:hypothetical protein